MAAALHAQIELQRSDQSQSSTPGQATNGSLVLRYFLSETIQAEKMAVKDKKARFTPFVPPTHFQQQVGWGTRLALGSH